MNRNTLTTADLQKIAELSKLTLPNDKTAVLTERLENILTLVNKMDDVDTQNIQPLAHSFHAAQPLREDVVTEKNQRDLFQQNAPKVEAGLYIVPKFLETE